MRTPFVAGNWKMNKTVAEARELLATLSAGLKAVDGVEKVICPPFIAVPAVANLLEGTDIELGVQNMHWEEKGAFTGEISPAMVKEFCKYAILGHSERRQYFGETDETVNKRVLAAQKHAILPIVCVGETLAENEAGQTADVVRRQTVAALQGVHPDFAPSLVLAYEPVWAIGTGKAASGESAQHVHGQVIRATLVELFGQATAQKIRILYGGSVTGANAAEFFSQPDIDGALVGGASLKQDFIAIAQAAAA
ncbi:MAG: triose-phosphate isomerase [Anaerolineales bacterium]|jgi:triosephosphate isomerase|nr:triose-phosphate isomerase [Anaerolineales bacterium]